MLQKPDKSEYAEFQHKYIKDVPEDVLPYLQSQKQALANYLSQYDEDDLSLTYEKGKWSIREVVAHIIDTEIIFDYRALCTSRNEKQVLPGFDQDEYVEPRYMDHMTKNYLEKYFSATRDQSLVLFDGFTKAQWAQVGNMSSYTMTLRSFPYMLAGHFDHHMKILKERYTF